MSTRKVAVIGGGVIGASWAAVFAYHGFEVVVQDPDPDIAAKAEWTVEEGHNVLKQLGPGPASLNIRFTDDLADAVSGAYAVQENGPERLELKRSIWSGVEAAAPRDALLLTSTSGIPAGEISAALKDPGRLVVGHPFNPPHLLPLVEVVGSRATTPAQIQAAVDFYTEVGKKPVVIDQEISGFVANRLQTALLREAIYLVDRGIVTEEALDDIVTSSIGVRWAVAGPFLSFHLGGGAGGLQHFLEHFGDSLQQRWETFESPRLNDSLREKLVAQAEGSYPVSKIPIFNSERDVDEVNVLNALKNRALKQN